MTSKSSGTSGYKQSGSKAAPTAAAPTQKKAEVLAKQQVKSAGGGEVRIHSRDGKIRDSDTVKPGNESKIKDKKH